MFSLNWAWTNAWANSRDAGDLRRHRAHYDVSVMWKLSQCQISRHWRCRRLSLYVIITTYGETRDGKVVITTTLGFQCPTSLDRWLLYDIIEPYMYIDGLRQDCNVSSTLATQMLSMQRPHSWTKPSICCVNCITYRKIQLGAEIWDMFSARTSAMKAYIFDTLRPRQLCRHFADIFKYIFLRKKINCS